MPASCSPCLLLEGSSFFASESKLRPNFLPIVLDQKKKPNPNSTLSTHPFNIRLEQQQQQQPQQQRAKNNIFEHKRINATVAPNSLGLISSLDTVAGEDSLSNPSVAAAGSSPLPVMPASLTDRLKKLNLSSPSLSSSPSVTDSKSSPVNHATSIGSELPDSSTDIPNSIKSPVARRPSPLLFSAFRDTTNPTDATIVATQQPGTSNVPTGDNGNNAGEDLTYEPSLFPAETTPIDDNANEETAIDDTASVSSQPAETLSLRSSRMVRKKSGELVKSSLKQKFRRPASLPATPTGLKNVHFDSKLEHVRHFLLTERPIAVSADSSPTPESSQRRRTSYFSSSETEDEDGNSSDGSVGKSQSILKIELPNFPADLAKQRRKAVFVDHVYLTHDRRNLMIKVGVRNLAFHKTVTVKFTWDYWKTVSEVHGQFMEDPRRSSHSHGPDCLDYFLASINISDIASLDDKSIYFCVRYDVAKDVYWDNNDSFNYEVDFRRMSIKHSSGLPRSRHTQRVYTGSRHTKRDSWPPLDIPSPAASPGAANKDLWNDSDMYDEMDSVYRKGYMQTSFSDTSLVSLSRPQSPMFKAKPPKNQGFTSRYDFGASLHEAMSAVGSREDRTAAYSRQNDRSPASLFMNGVSPPDTSFSPPEGLPTQAFNANNLQQGFIPSSQPSLKQPVPNKVQETAQFDLFSPTESPPDGEHQIPRTLARPQMVTTSIFDTDGIYPSRVSSAGSTDVKKDAGVRTLMNERPLMDSSSYRNLLDNYCFFQQPNSKTRGETSVGNLDVSAEITPDRLVSSAGTPVQTNTVN